MDTVKWYILYNGEKIGPMSARNMLAYNAAPDTMVWTEGMTQWQPIYTLPDLMQLLSSHKYQETPKYAPGSDINPPVAPNYSTKDKTACGLLAILLGGLGIQYFYLGKVGGGFITILLSLVTCGFWSVITLIQGILMLTMSKAEFDQKFVFTNKTFPLF